MPATIFLVRAVVTAPQREKFEHWYSTDHLPWAMRAFKCQKAWRFWSGVEEGVLFPLSRLTENVTGHNAAHLYEHAR
jgi:hypothetical protein